MSSNLLMRPRTSADSQFVFAGNLNQSMVTDDKQKALRAVRASRDSGYGNSNNFTTNISTQHVSIYAS